ncbi:anti-sigma F factor antagonist [Aureibacillus halotolerans]|uniref:Anti-sigma F factor antagonist n=1 Tax=Aureibacillus halotolerans TaxID=1508390 RepID=A0A4R6U533_9BACI|nr:anti-sigma F factor antagonist [Aureibacillus halotolerans]TDQ41600.1 SpoIIAA-like anti-anti-sigma regulatory factor [Aureibacillus halotolerans]
MSLEVKMNVKNDVLCVRLVGELDHHEADTLRETLVAKFAESGTKHLILNLEALSFMDSSGLGVILGRYKQVQKLGGQVYVCAISKPVQRLFEMSGMFKIIAVAENENVCLEALGVA